MFGSNNLLIFVFIVAVLFLCPFRIDSEFGIVFYRVEPGGYWSRFPIKCLIQLGARDHPSVAICRGEQLVLIVLCTAGLAPEANTSGRYDLRKLSAIQSWTIKVLLTYSRMA